MLSTDWAKTTQDGLPGISVRQHCHAVRYVAEELLHHFPHFCEDNDIIPEAVAFLALAHDVGKISLDFLQKCSVWLQHEGLALQAQKDLWASNYARWHPEISQKSLQHFLQGHQHELKTAYFWAAVVGAHHGRLLANGSARPVRFKETERALEDERQACLQEFWEECSRPLLPSVDGSDPRLWSVAGLVTLADWLGSDEKFFPADRVMTETELRRTATDAVATVGLGMPPVVKEESFADIFSGRTPYAMQTGCAAAVSGPGVYVLEAPMGMGKTEAALWTAYKLLQTGDAQGVYFALPTQATSNRMFQRLQDFARHICPNAIPAQLIHGNAWLCRTVEPLAAPGTADAPSNEPPLRPDGLWFNTSRRSLFAPFGVGTVDQALLAVLAVKHFPLRRFALSRKVVILDEVHTYDVYTGTLIQSLCKELAQLKCTVLILSATLTEGVRRSLLGETGDEDGEEPAPYPRFTGHAKNGQRLAPLTPPAPRDKEVLVTHATSRDARQQAIDLACRGSQVLWVCDTVDSAQQTYLALKQQSADQANIAIGLLHSRFPFFRRDELERQWMDRFGPKGTRDGGTILVSTQIVEQSVDLDADALFSELAPTDMLLQRLGRLWRHPRANRPVDAPLFCLLDDEATLDQLRNMDTRSIKKAFGAKGHVYKPWVLLRSLEQWANLKRIALPSGIRPIMTTTYAPADSPPAWQALEEENWGEDLAARTVASMGTNIWKPLLDDATIPSTRLSDREEHAFVLCTEDAGTSLTLLNGATATLISNEPTLETARALGSCTVKVPGWHFTKHPHDSRLAPFHIDGRILVQADGTTDTPELAPGKGLFWDNDLGLAVRKEKQ